MIYSEFVGYTLEKESAGQNAVPMQCSLQRNILYYVAVYLLSL